MRVEIEWEVGPRLLTIKAEVTLGRRASFRGHPDHWEDDEPTEVEILAIRDEDEAFTEAELEFLVGAFGVCEIEDRLVQQAESQACRMEDDAAEARASALRDE